MIVGCRRDDGRWLLIRRSHHVSLAPGESLCDAVVREYREEMGVDVEPTTCVWQRVYDDKPLILWAWLAELKSLDLEINPMEVAEPLWLTAEEATQHPDALPYQDEIVTAFVSGLGV